MGILTKVLGFKVLQKAVSHLNARSAALEAQAKSRPLPAAQATTPTMKSRLLANPVAQRAALVYQRNPKTVATVGTLILAAVAATIAKKRGMI